MYVPTLTTQVANWMASFISSLSIFLIFRLLIYFLFKMYFTYIMIHLVACNQIFMVWLLLIRGNIMHMKDRATVSVLIYSLSVELITPPLTSETFNSSLDLSFVVLFQTS